MSKTIFWASALCAVAAVPVLADQWTKSFSVGTAGHMVVGSARPGGRDLAPTRRSLGYSFLVMRSQPPNLPIEW